jgi:hypothetical protein
MPAQICIRQQWSGRLWLTASVSFRCQLVGSIYQTFYSYSRELRTDLWKIHLFAADLESIWNRVQKGLIPSFHKKVFSLQQQKVATNLWRWWWCCRWGGSDTAVSR